MLLVLEVWTAASNKKASRPQCEHGMAGYINSELASNCVHSAVLQIPPIRSSVSWRRLRCGDALAVAKVTPEIIRPAWEALSGAVFFLPTGAGTH